MLVADLQDVLEALAPAALAQPGDNCGLLVGDEKAPIRRVLAALELTDAVLDEAVGGGFDTILTHHPFLYAPVRTLVASHPRGKLLRRLVEDRITLIACHTNLDSAPGGLADIAAEALGLRGAVPLEPAAAGWVKLVGFVPQEAVDRVAAAVFAAGAGSIGEYAECAFATEGTGWFTAGPAAHPAIGEVGRPERTPEVRWETVVPRGRLGAAVRVFVAAHPYEEPAFDIYPVEDVLPGVGLGRVGTLDRPVRLADLAELTAGVYESCGVSWSGDGSRMVQKVGVLPGSGRGALDTASAECEVLITGDLGHHDAERAAERGCALIDVPHGDFEWWAFKRWVPVLAERLARAEVGVTISQAWRSSWSRQPGGCPSADDDMEGVLEKSAAGRGPGPLVRIWIDGGSRGNPGPSAIGVVIEDADGVMLESVGRCIGVVTNNVAEYRALLVALELAERLGAREVELSSDSELLVKQMLGQYKVKKDWLKPLHEEARKKGSSFARFAIRHIEREENARADALVNQALDEQERAGL